MKVADVMTTRVISVKPDASTESTAQLMLKIGISGVPVEDESGTLVEIVTEGDFLRRAELGTDRRRPRWLEVLLGPGLGASEYIHTRARTIADIMTRDVVSVTEDTSLNDVVRLMEKHRIKRMPVLRDAKLVGIISRSNLLQALATLTHDKTPTTASDSDIRRQLTAELGSHFWSPQRSTNIIVKDGVVDLYGIIFNDRERDAMRVAAENIPGVKAVRDHLTWIEPYTGFVISEPDRRTTQAPNPALDENPSHG